ncbi:hypothetical protein [Nocardia africana]|nr:hypothetical protein [Nocardia africana]MCC3313645.1 hypothetical protein [Nocardia africana]
MDFKVQFPDLAEASAPWRNSINLGALVTAIRALFAIRENADLRETYLTDLVRSDLRDAVTAEIRSDFNARPAARLANEDVEAVIADELDAIVDELRTWLSTELTAWMAEIYPIVEVEDWLDDDRPGGRGIDLLMMADAIGLNSYMWHIDTTAPVFAHLNVVAGTEPGLLVLASLYAATAGNSEGAGAPTPAVLQI